MVKQVQGIMTTEQLISSFHGRIVGTKRNKTIIAKIILLLPSEIIDQLISSTWFVSTPHETFGFVLSKDDIKDRNVIFLSDELLKESKLQMAYTILHEIGHVILGHRNSFHEAQSTTEIRSQEEEADEFAMRYMEKLK